MAEHLKHLSELQDAIARLSSEIAERLQPYEELLKRLETIPGVKRRLAQVILAEAGPDMRRFPSAHHLASWAGMCPGNHESAGKRLSGKTRKGSQWLWTALVEASHATSHRKDSYLSAHYHRIVGWPHFRGVGELGNSSVMLLFIGHWTEIAQGRMAALPIVEDFDVLKNRQLRPPFEFDRYASPSTGL